MVDKGVIDKVLEMNKLIDLDLIINSTAFTNALSYVSKTALALCFLFLLTKILINKIV